jgi:hypothetical protein
MTATQMADIAIVAQVGSADTGIGIRIAKTVIDRAAFDSIPGQLRWGHTP